MDKKLRKIESQKAIVNSEDKYRSLVNNLMEGLIILDFSGKILYTNPAVPLILGYAESDNIQFVGRNMTELLHPDSIPNRICHVGGPGEIFCRRLYRLHLKTYEKGRYFKNC